MIYVIDHGFGSIPPGHCVLDSQSPGDTGNTIYTLIRDINPDGWMHLIDVGENPDETAILAALDEVDTHPWDHAIVITSRIWPDTQQIRRRIAHMQSKYVFFASAGNLGNHGGNFENQVPHGMMGVQVIGSLNKSQIPASHNNQGDIDNYAPGTNIFINGALRSGSEIALAIFAAFYSYYRSHTETADAVTAEFYRLINHRFQCNELRYNYLKSDAIPVIEYINAAISNRNFPTLHMFLSHQACDIRAHEQDLRANLRQNKKIILNAYPEGFYHTGKQQDFLIKVFESEGKDPQQDLLIITGSMDLEQIKQSPLGDCYIHGPFISHWLCGFNKQTYMTRLEHDVSKKTHTFLCLNRITRPHRLAVTAEMIQRGLMDTNFVSFAGTNVKNHWGMITHATDGNLALDPDLAEYYYNIVGDRDYHVDDIDFGENQALTPSPRDFYERSFFSLVNETFCFEQDLFPSEKIYKAIIHEHPFVLVGSPGMLAMLKQQGFRTYGEWFDESYDDIPDGVQRIRAIMDEVQRIDSLPLKEKQAMFEQTRHIAEYNRHVLMDPDFIAKNSNQHVLSKLINTELNYDTTHEPSNSFVREVSVNRNKVTIVSGYNDFADVRQTVVDNPHKTILVDFSRKYVQPEVFRYLADLPDLRNVVLTANYTSHNISDAEQQCRDLGMIINYEHHFVNNKHIYQPHREFKQVDKRIFTMYTGKSRDFRTAMVGLLSHHNLLQYGHVSYFGDQHFAHSDVPDFFQSDAPEDLKQLVQQGLERITMPLALDTNFLTWNTSHDPRFDASYYQSSDFTVVLESDDRDLVEIPLITEKSLRPLMIGRPVMIYGARGQTDELRKALMNVESWNMTHWDSLLNWVQHQEYDHIPDRWSRLLAFFDQLRTQIQERL